MASTKDPAGSVSNDPRYKEVIARWESFWSLEDVGRPLWMVPTSPVLSVGATGRVPWRTLLQDRETQLNAQLALLQWRQSLDAGDDFVPHLQVYQGVTVFASAFGCRVEFFDHTLPWAHPVIRPEDPPEKVYDLPAPAVTDGQLGTVLDWGDYFVQQAAGRYALALTDLQGPLDSAYQVWEPTAFMVAMNTNPREVHHLMRLVTDRQSRSSRARPIWWLAIIIGFRTSSLPPTPSRRHSPRFPSPSSSAFSRTAIRQFNSTMGLRSSPPMGSL